MEKSKFRFAVRKFQPFENAMQKIWESFCKERGLDIEAEFVTMDLPELHGAIIGRGGLKNGDWDAAHIVTDWLDEAYSSESLEALNPYLEAQNLNLEVWSNSLLEAQVFEQKEIVGLPFHDGPECLIIRKDLFESEEEQSNFYIQFGRPLAIPKTWDEFLEVASFFQRPDQNLYGTVLAGYPDGHNTVYDFCLQLWTRGGNLLNEKGDININQQEAIDALDFYKSWVNNNNIVHPHAKDYESVQCGLAFARGEAAMMINWFGFAAMCEVVEESKVKGKVDVAQIPSLEYTDSASLNIYWLYAIGKGSDKKQLAFDFIQYATSAENDKLLTLEGGIGCRKSTWHDAEINRTIPYYHKLEQLHLYAKTLPRTATWAKIAEYIDEMMVRAMTTDETLANILVETQEKIDTCR